jgi:hypothetical protein
MASSSNFAHYKLKYSQNLPIKLVHQIQHAFYRVCGKPVAWGKEKNFVDWILKKS